jgi:hypothetical protein
MSLDPVINFGKVEVSTGYSATATSIALSSGEGAKLPSTFSYNMVWWNFTDYADPADDPNVEIVRVSGRATDTLTVIRAQEGTSGTTKNTASKTYKMLLGLTKKTIDDLDVVDINNGTFREPFDADVTSDGTKVLVTIEQTGTGDLTEQFSSGMSTFDCTPACTISLTAGSDASPQTNWIYILQSGPGVLVKSTSAWPTAEHIKIGFFFVQSAASVQTAGGAIINQNINNELSDTNNMGHLAHIGEKLRLMGSTYFSGVAGNGATASYFTISAGNTEFISTAGVLYQFHKQTFPAFDTSSGSTIHVLNSSVSAYRAITDLFSITTDSTGATITANKYFNLVFWGVINKTGEYQVVMCNVPGGFYNSSSDAQNDVSSYDVFTIPREFSIDSSNGFLICRTTFQMGATWSHVATIDLRGSTPQSATGGAAGIATTFADNTFAIFDNTDNTKVIAISANTITTGTTRTLGVLDKDYDIGDLQADGSIALTGTWDLAGNTLSNPSGIDHGEIGGLSDNDHTQYFNTVTTTSSIAITSNGQSLSATIVTAGLTGLGTVTVGNVDSIISSANTVTAGKVELATTAEINTGTDATRAVTPDNLAASYAGTKEMIIILQGPTTDSVAGNTIAQIPVPSSMNGMNLVEVQANLTVVGTTGTETIQIHNVTQAADMLSTVVSIDSGEISSSTAATAYAIDTANDDITTGDILRVDRDSIHTTAGKGTSLLMIFRAP